MLRNGKILGATARDSWRPVTAAFLAQNGLPGTASQCFPTEPNVGARAKTVSGGLEDQREHDCGWGIFLVRFLDDPAPIKLPLTPARSTKYCNNVSNRPGAPFSAKTGKIRSKRSL